MTDIKTSMEKIDTCITSLTETENNKISRNETKSVESVKNDFRTKSDEEVFDESLPALTTRRRSSFPLISVSVESDDTCETASLCEGNFQTLKNTPNHILAHSTSALPTNGTSHLPCHNRLLQVRGQATQPGLGSTLSLASHKLLKSPCAATTPARAQSILFAQPKRKWYHLLQQSSVQFGLDFCYATEGALVTPILLQLGLPDDLYGLAWFLAPILGFILAPLIGSASDRCYSPLGQRRPFLLMLGICVMVGSALYLNSADLGELISKDNATTWGIAITVLGVVLTDFSADSCNSPFKAYLMDTCNLDDLKRVLGMRSILGGIGGGLGYICIGIDWEQTFFGQALGSQLRVIFLLNVVSFAISLILTMTSIPEIPLERHPSYSRQSDVEYVPCGSDDVRTKQDGMDSLESKGRVKRNKCSLWEFFKQFCRRRMTGAKSVPLREDSEPCESGERTFLSVEDGEERNGSQHKKGDLPQKNSGSYGNQSKGEPLGRTTKNKENTSKGKKLFVPKKKVKKSSKKSAVTTLGGGSCVVKVSLSDDPKDILNKAAKFPAGDVNQVGSALPQCSNANSAVAISISNSTADITAGDDVEGGESDDDDDKKHQPQSLQGLLRSAIHMPKELRYMCLTNFFGWAGITILLCFYTDFVAQAIYHGDPNAPVDSEEYRLYEEGVKMGSWGLCVYSFSSFFLGLFMTIIQRYLSQKVIYVSSQLLFAVTAGAMAMLTNNIHTNLLLCVGLGINTVVVMTIPHNILANYHKCEQYKYPEGGLPRGLGTDMACFDSQVFLSQITISAVMGPLIQLTGSHVAIVVSAALMAFLASLSAAFLVTYEIKEK